MGDVGLSACVVAYTLCDSTHHRLAENHVPTQKMTMYQIVKTMIMAERMSLRRSVYLSKIKSTSVPCIASGIPRSAISCSLLNLIIKNIFQ